MSRTQKLLKRIQQICLEYCDKSRKANIDQTCSHLPGYEAGRSSATPLALRTLRRYPPTCNWEAVSGLIKSQLKGEVTPKEKETVFIKLLEQGERSNNTTTVHNDSSSSSHRHASDDQDEGDYEYRDRRSLGTSSPSNSSHHDEPHFLPNEAPLQNTPQPDKAPPRPLPPEKLSSPSSELSSSDRWGCNAALRNETSSSDGPSSL